MTVEQKAKQIWQGMNANERSRARFGLLPSEEILEAVFEGFDNHRLCAALRSLAENVG